MNIPPELRYTASHEWVRMTESTARIGITDFAQHEITDVVHVELPEVGRSVTAGNPCAVVESVKSAFDIYAPVSGEISAVNTPVTDHPELLNSDPYGAGWLFEIKATDISQVGQLKDAAAYKDSCA